ncbi:hypothetical protein COT30_05260 [Candidatus Micrarchaeota archaeon CG08_land_8_20_14_0_20_49_17]|nr:MAG: hypothetical protein COT30_05260 [Candidatus Micrarchaeota archaeon CG08_land_8_20_14_0_20_49_17]
MISPNIITEISKNGWMGWAVIEKDYFLTLVLDAIANTPILRDNLVFKGGTALRKVYFGDYRYSEDLDFTMKREFAAAEIRGAFETALAYLGRDYNASLRIKDFDSKRHFTDIKIQFVGLKGNKNTIAVDMGPDEVIVEEPLDKPILNNYYEKIFSVKTYSLEEITAEKLRSLLQRTRVRDYYDAWYLLTKAKLDRKKIAWIFARKVGHKKLAFTGKAQLLNSEKLAQAEAFYHSQIGNLLRNPPPFKKISGELGEAIAELDLK